MQIRDLIEKLNSVQDKTQEVTVQFLGGEEKTIENVEQRNGTKPHVQLKLGKKWPFFYS